MHYFFTAIDKCLTFSGRATRKEYWYYVLFAVISIVGLALLSETLWFGGPGASIQSAALGLVILFLMFVGISVSVRRLHDRGYSGWWYLLYLVPGGNIFLIVNFCMDGTPGDNAYGPDPKGREPVPPAPVRFTTVTEPRLGLLDMGRNNDDHQRLDKLAKLGDLYRNGILTEPEFNRAKSNILSGSRMVA